MIKIRQLGTVLAGMALMTVLPCAYGQSRADLDKIAASQEELRLWCTQRRIRKFH